MQKNSGVDISGLDLLFLEVNNLQESIAFYSDQLGFDVLTINPDAEPPMATLSAGRLKITIVQQLETMLRRGRGVHFFFGITNVDLYFEELQRKNVEVQPPADEGWGGRFITVQDPDKYRFFFVEWADE